MEYAEGVKNRYWGVAVGGYAMGKWILLPWQTMSTFILFGIKFLFLSNHLKPLILLGLLDFYFFINLPFLLIKTQVFSGPWYKNGINSKFLYHAFFLV